MSKVSFETKIRKKNCLKKGSFTKTYRLSTLHGPNFVNEWSTLHREWEWAKTERRPWVSWCDVKIVNLEITGRCYKKHTAMVYLVSRQGRLGYTSLRLHRTSVYLEKRPVVPLSAGDLGIFFGQITQLIQVKISTRAQGRTELWNTLHNFIMTDSRRNMGNT